jgi:hypothetical protein
MADNDVLANLFRIPGNSRQLYLSYLTTDALSSVVEHCDEVIFLPAKMMHRVNVGLYKAIRHDAITELRGRQLNLFKGPDETLGSGALE